MSEISLKVFCIICYYVHGFVYTTYTQICSHKHLIFIVIISISCHRKIIIRSCHSRISLLGILQQSNEDTILLALAVHHHHSVFHRWLYLSINCYFLSWMAQRTTHLPGRCLMYLPLIRETLTSISYFKNRFQICNDYWWLDWFHSLPVGLTLLNRMASRHLPLLKFSFYLFFSLIF